MSESIERRAMKLVVKESKLIRGHLDKDQRVPGWSLHYVCPKCGAEGCDDYTFESNMSDLWQPNKMHELVLYCGGRNGCGHEWTAGQIRVDLGLSVVDTTGAPVTVERVK